MGHPKSATFQAQRAEHFKARARRAEQKAAKLTRELRDVHRDRFVEGSARTMAAVYAALDFSLGMWMGQRMLACRVKVPPFKLPPATEQIVRREVAALLKACEITSVDVGSIEL